MSNPNRINPLTPATAETNARLQPISETGPRENHGSYTPPAFVPPQLAAVAGLVAVALPLVAGFLPPPLNGLALILAFVAAFLAGVPLRVPNLVQSKPVVGQALVPALGGLVPVLGTAAQSLTGTAQAVVYTLALVVAWLAGVAMPAPRKS